MDLKGHGVHELWERKRAQKQEKGDEKLKREVSVLETSKKEMMDQRAIETDYADPDWGKSSGQRLFRKERNRGGSWQCSPKMSVEGENRKVQ